MDRDHNEERLNKKQQLGNALRLMRVALDRAEQAYFVGVWYECEKELSPTEPGGLTYESKGAHCFAQSLAEEKRCSDARGDKIGAVRKIRESDK